MTAKLKDFICRLPKAELHLHVEGAVSPETLVALSQRHDSKPMTLEEAQSLYQYTDFTGFLMAFKAVTERLRTADDYDAAAACSACETARAQSGDSAALCPEHLRKALGF